MGFWTKYFTQQIFGNWLGGHIWSADRTAQYREYLKSDAYFIRAYSKANINDKNGACKDVRKAQSLGYLGDLFTVIKYACN